MFYFCNSACREGGRRRRPNVRAYLCIAALLSPVTGLALASEKADPERDIALYLQQQELPDSIREIYSSVAYRPLWYQDGVLTPRARNAIARMELADSDGLNAADYKISALDAHRPNGEIPAWEIPGLDVALTQSLLHFASDLYAGRLSVSRADPKWHIPEAKFDASAWLTTVLTASDIGSALDGLAPTHPVYRNLVKALKDHQMLREAGGWPEFPAKGPRKLEPGKSHEQVALLRERLRVTDGPLASTDDLQFFDADLETAVKSFQRRHGLNDDGVVGRRTRAALRVPIETRIDQILAALERWRWMPRDLGTSYVLVNVPAYRLWYYDNGEPELTMRTIVGKYKRQTPTFAASISYFVLRPKWYVPHKIAVKDLVPKAQEDPEYYQKGGYVIYEKATGLEVDPANVDWSVHGEGKPFPYRLVQGAGASNALGDIKFMFKNPYGVYLHDTSSPRLFTKDSRAFSSGCVRVQQPLELASRILSEADPVTPESVGEMIAGAPKNRHLTLTEQVPLYVVYLTSWADEENAYFYEDVYRRDRKLLEAL